MVGCQITYLWRCYCLSRIFRDKLSTTIIDENGCFCRGYFLDALAFAVVEIFAVCRNCIAVCVNSFDFDLMIFRVVGELLAVCVACQIAVFIVGIILT